MANQPVPALPALTFEEEVERTQVWARAFLMGPTSAGKSRAAFELASRMFGGDLPITYINTERDREKLYADRYKFSLINLAGLGSGPANTELVPELFVHALDLAEQRNPGGIYIVDSASHEWSAILSMSDRFRDWGTLTPRHDSFVLRLQQCDAHVIVCCRAKMKYEQTSDNDVRLIGLGPEQRPNFQYEFNLVGTLEVTSHEVTWSGHVDPLIGQTHNMLQDAQHVADTYTRWLSEGVNVEPVRAASEQEIAALRASLTAEGISAERIESGFSTARQMNRGKLSPDYVAEQLAGSAKRRERKEQGGPAATAPEPAAAEPEAPHADGALPAGVPAESWSVAQLDRYAENEGIHQDASLYPAAGTKKEKAAALNAWLASAAAADADGSAEDVPFGDEAAEPVQEALA